MTDLGVPHLARRQSDRLAGRLRAWCADSRPRARRRRAYRRAPRRFPGPGGASPQPSRMTRATGAGSPRRLAPARQIASNDSQLERGAADERAVDVRQPEQHRRVVRLDRAAVQHGASCSDLTNACASCAISGVAVRPVPIAQTGSYAMTSRSCRGRTDTWRSRTLSVSPASRSASVSPTHAMTARPASSAASARRRTVSSVSPKSCRRSEWPTIAPVTPSSSSIGADTSPVNAPSSSQWTFCAYTRDEAFRRRTPPASPRARRSAGTRPRRRPERVLGKTPDLRRELARLVGALEHLPVPGDQHQAAPPLPGSPRCPEAPCLRGARARRRRRWRSTRCGRRGRAPEPPAPSRRRRRPCTRRASATACATTRVPSANRSHSKTPIGPFQNTVFAVADGRGEAVAWSRARRPGRAIRPARRRTASPGSARPPRMPRRRRRPWAARPRRGADCSSRSSSAIFPPMSTTVRASAQLLEDAELVLDLRAARDEHERPLDVAEKSSEHLQLLLEQKPGVRRQEPGDALRRSVRAVRGAERVVDEDVHPRGESSRRLGIVLRLARVEARVLEHGETLVRDQLAQALGNRRDRECRIGSLRPSEVRADRRRSQRPAPGGARGSAATPGYACRPRCARPRAAR